VPSSAYNKDNQTNKQGSGPASIKLFGIQTSIKLFGIQTSIKLVGIQASIKLVGLQTSIKLFGIQALLFYIIVLNKYLFYLFSIFKNCS